MQRIRIIETDQQKLLKWGIPKKVYEGYSNITLERPLNDKLKEFITTKQEGKVLAFCALNNPVGSTKEKEYFYIPSDFIEEC